MSAAIKVDRKVARRLAVVAIPAARPIPQPCATLIALLACATPFTIRKRP